MKTLASRLPRPLVPSVWMPIVSDRVVWALAAGIVLVGLLDPGQVSPSLAFMRKALAGMAPFFAIAVAFAAYAKASGLDRTLARVFSGKPWMTILAAAATGALSPFCSCGVIPVMAAMLRAGVPLAPVMAFCIASPVMDPEMFIITAAGISPEFAVVKTITAFDIGLLAGFTIYGLQRAGRLQQALRPSLETVGCCSAGAREEAAAVVTWRFWGSQTRRGIFFHEIMSTGWFLGKWLTVAFFLESLMIAYIPPEWISRLVGGESWMAIPLAALVGSLLAMVFGLIVLESLLLGMMWTACGALLAALILRGLGLAGNDAPWSLDRLKRDKPALRRAVEIDPDDAESRLHLTELIREPERTAPPLPT